MIHGPDSLDVAYDFDMEDMAFNKKQFEPVLKHLIEDVLKLNTDESKLVNVEASREAK